MGRGLELLERPIREGMRLDGLDYLNGMLDGILICRKNVLSMGCLRCIGADARTQLAMSFEHSLESVLKCRTSIVYPELMSSLDD